MSELALVIPIESHPRFRRELEPWVTKRHLALHLNRTTRWVELRVAEGMPSQLRGRRRWFRLSDVQEWLNTRGGAA